MAPVMRVSKLLFHGSGFKQDEAEVGETVKLWSREGGSLPLSLWWCGVWCVVVWCARRHTTPTSGRGTHLLVTYSSGHYKGHVRSRG